MLYASVHDGMPRLWRYEGLLDSTYLWDFIVAVLTRPAHCGLDTTIRLGFGFSMSLITFNRPIGCVEFKRSDAATHRIGTGMTGIVKVAADNAFLMTVVGRIDRCKGFLDYSSAGAVRNVAATVNNLYVFVLIFFCIRAWRIQM